MVAPLLIVSSSGWACTSSRRFTLQSSRIAPRPGAAPRARGAPPSTAGLQDLQGFRGVAGVGGAGAAVLERGRNVDALLPLGSAELVGELLAAGGEPAARGRVRRAGDVARDDGPQPLPLPPG